MKTETSIDELWDSALLGQAVFRPDQAASLPGAARRYLEHAIAPGTPLASAVRLQMHGEIKLRRWLPFTADQIIRSDREMIWRASVPMHGMPIRGSDRLVKGEGSMRWKLLGIIPIVTASGADITRSAAGRIAAESVWLPSMLCRNDVTWSEPANASFMVHDERVELELVVDDRGALESVTLRRWGNPEGGEFRYADFGAFVEEEKKFSGYTIPSRLPVGWHVGTDRFESEGEFFRVTIDDARYR
jgi:hypothetical protein